MLASVEGVGASWKRCPKNPYADHVTGRHPADKEPNRAERDLSSATPNRVKPPERFGARGAPPGSFLPGPSSSLSIFGRALIGRRPSTRHARLGWGSRVSPKTSPGPSAIPRIREKRQTKRRGLNRRNPLVEAALPLRTCYSRKSVLCHA